MSKLPEKFKSIIVQQVQPNEASVEIVEMLTAEQSKINEIIDYLATLEEQNTFVMTPNDQNTMADALYEQQKPCGHKNIKVFLDENNDFKSKECKDCGNNLS